MDDLKDFERFEPSAWQQRGIVRPLVPKKAQPIRRKQPLPILLAIPLFGFGIATEQCVTRVDYTATAGGGFPISQAHRRTGPDIDKRIRDIGDLKEGWYDGEGTAFDRGALATLRTLLVSMPINSKVPFPYLYPEMDGGISAEWTFGDWEVSLEFDRNMTRAAALAISTQTREKERIEVRLDAANSAVRLARFVERYHRIEHSIT